jgi:cysteine desulfurase/selenocysteine lyase
MVAYALEVLGEIPGVTLYGPSADHRAGIVSFTVAGVHPHDVAQVLDLDGIAVRAGHHCCQPLMRKLGVAATSRASFYLYNVPGEVDRLAAGVRRAQEMFA